jgi:FeS assembly SUF system regulator
MLRVGKLTDYATVLMTCLAQSPDAIHRSVDLAAQARLELPTVSKVLKALTLASLVESFRGATGGYKLARAPNEITVADIVAAMEGPIGMTECSTHRGLCDHESHCGVRGNWRKISTAIEAALRSVSLADMVPRPPPPRRRIPLRVDALSG